MLRLPKELSKASLTKFLTVGRICYIWVAQYLTEHDFQFLSLRFDTLTGNGLYWGKKNQIVNFLKYIAQKHLACFLI